MKHFKDIFIVQDTISIMAGGKSAYNISDKDYAEIYNKSYCIGVNEFNRKLHARLWIDYTMTAKLKQVEKTCLYITRLRSITNKNDEFIKKIDYIYDNKKEGVKYNYTVWTIFYLCKKHFPDKRILFFGLDCDKKYLTRKSLIDNKIQDVVPPDYADKLEAIKVLFETEYNVRPEQFKDTWNCNETAEINMPKINWKEIL